MVMLPGRMEKKGLEIGPAIGAALANNLGYLHVRCMYGSRRCTKARCCGHDFYWVGKQKG